MKRLTLGVIMAVLTYMSALAVAPSVGKVYRLKNAGYSNYMTDNGPKSSVGCSALKTGSNSQLWLVGQAPDGSSLTLQSLATGLYLFSPDARSTGWTMVSSTDDAHTHFTIIDLNNNQAIRRTAAADNNAAHCDGSMTVVGWSYTDTQNSQWQFEAVDMTQAEIDSALGAPEAMQSEVGKASTYQAHLDALFSDKACTKLKVTDYADNADYLALPAALQQMVRKVATDTWAETTGDWDSGHAKKYRVQLYEPFSEGNMAAQLAGIQAYTNMNNPTGIIADSNQPIYVMVNDAVPAGSTLYIKGFSDVGMHNGPTDGYELKQGLNIIPNYSDCAHFFVYYVVNTVTTNDKDKKVPSEYKVTAFNPIKIHIEGGRLNGFFNPIGDDLYTADTRADFDYTSSRAEHPMYDLVGKYVILHFHKDNVGNNLGVINALDAEKNPGDKKEYDPVNIIKAWDNMCIAERLLMGIQSDEEVLNPYDSAIKGHFEPLSAADGEAYPGFLYSDYFNNRMMGISMESCGYMNATSWRTAYNPSTVASILTDLPYGNIWGPAHEYGHMNQQPMKIAGTTEESNNIFSNVVLYFAPHGTTSRCDYPSVQQTRFSEGQTFLEHDTWGTTRMFWQLFCYYHITGKNLKFYPRLYELLRKDPLTRQYNLNPKTDMLKFAVKCCMAAEEDLTNFFEAWGFFVPQENFHIGDYSNFMSTLTQEDIDEIKEQIKALGYPKNDAIILIDDRPGSDKPDHEYYKKAQSGQYGGLNDFKNGVAAGGSVSATLGEDGTLQFTVGEGASAGIGYLLYDADGTLIGFSNSDSMVLSEEAKAAVLDGTAVLVAANADPEAEPLPITPEINTATRRGLLTELLATTQKAIDGVDTTETRLGMFRPGYTDKLAEIRTASQAVANNANATDEQLRDAYNALLTEYEALLDNRYARVTAISGNKYQILSRRTYSNKSWDLADMGESKVVLQEANAENDNHLWTLELVSELYGTYYMRNVATGKYISCNKDDNGVVTTTANANHDNIYELRPTDDPNYMGILRYRKTGESLNISGDTSTGKISTWGWGDQNSQWTIVLAEADEVAVEQFNLQEAADKAKALIDATGTVTTTTSPVALTASSYFSNAPAGGSQNYGNLCDNDANTIFHSAWTADHSPEALHHIGIDLGEGNELATFTLNWKNRTQSGQNQVEYLKKFNLQVSVDGTNYTTVSTVSNGLSGESAATYASPVFSAGTPCRYVRIEAAEAQNTVTKNEVKYPFFVMAELGISAANAEATALTAYAGCEPELIELYNQYLYVQSIASASGISLETAQAALTSITAATDALLAAREDAAALNEAIAEAEALLAMAGTTPGVEAPVALTEDSFYSNAPHMGDGNDKFTTWDVILDNDISTYFHSNWAGTKASDDGLDHYIRIEAPAGETFRDFEINITPRNDSGSASKIKSYKVQSSVDGETWTDISEVTNRANSNAAFTTGELTAPFGTRYVRFMVTDTHITSPGNQEHHCFAIAELSMTNRSDYDSKLPEGLEGLDQTLIQSVISAIVTSRELQTPTHEERTAATEAIMTATAALNNAMGNKFRQILKDLCATASSSLGEAGEFTATAGTERLALDDEQFFSNAKCQDTRWGDQFTSFSVINDNNDDTFFHSDYSDQAPDEDHHIGADLGHENATGCLQLFYKTRAQKGQSQKEHIIAYELQGSNDGTNYTTVLTSSAELPSDFSTAHNSEVLTLNTAYRYYRMVVTEAQNESNNHARFAISEFGFIPATWVAVPNSTTYPDMTATHMLDVKEAYEPAISIAEDPTTTAEQLHSSYLALQPKVEALQAAMENKKDQTSISEIEDSEAEQVIFNLQGVRLSRVSGPGIYIINGRKVLVR